MDFHSGGKVQLTNFSQRLQSQLQLHVLLSIQLEFIQLLLLVKSNSYTELKNNLEEKNMPSSDSNKIENTKRYF